MLIVELKVSTFFRVLDCILRNQKFEKGRQVRDQGTILPKEYKPEVAQYGWHYYILLNSTVFHGIRMSDNWL
jgi:hypothetical protein